MKPSILPKLGIIHFKNTMEKPILLKDSTSNTERLKKSKSHKLISTSFKKVNNPILLHNSFTNFKLIWLKNLLMEKKNQKIINNSNRAKSIREGFFSIIKNNQSSLIEKNDNSYIKKEKIEGNKNYQFFQKTFRNYSKSKENPYMNNYSNNMNKKNSILFYNKNSTTYRSLNKHNIFNSSIDRIKSYKKRKTKLENNLSEISVKRYFKDEDKFKKFIIERFISKKFFINDEKEIKHGQNELNNSNTFYKRLKYIKNKNISNNYRSSLNNNIHKKEPKHRIIYVVLDGTIIINENNIQGKFVNIPSRKELKKLNKEKRDNLMANLLVKLQNVFGTKKPIVSMFSPDKEVLLDLIEIKNEYKYIYISKSILCKGISIISSPNLVELYTTEFIQYLRQKKDNIINIKKQSTKINYKQTKSIFNFKIRKINKGINLKKEKLKPHYSFALGENEIESNDYFYYSENEEKKNNAYEEIKNNCIFKNDFYFYINDKDIAEKVKSLKTKLNFKKFLDLRKSYNRYETNFNKLLNRYKKELSKKLGINTMDFNSDIKKKKDYDFEDLDNQFDKLYLKRESEKQKINKKLNNKFCHNVDKNVNKHYAYFVLYNIPKILKEYKNYNRQRLFEIFTQFKDLMALSFSLNKNEFILKNGIDFHTFWNCVEELTDEREKFAKKLFTQINKSNSSVLNIEDFIKGMYFIKNSEITEKLELFLKSLDISGKGEITFKEAMEISKESILRNLADNNMNDKDNLVLNELSTFFANFIFKLVGVERDKCLKINDLKKSIIEGNNENNVEYLEMFCGANRTK